MQYSIAEKERPNVKAGNLKGISNPKKGNSNDRTWKKNLKTIIRKISYINGGDKNKVDVPSFLIPSFTSKPGGKFLFSEEGGIDRSSEPFKGFAKIITNAEGMSKIPVYVYKPKVIARSPKKQSMIFNVVDGDYIITTNFKNCIDNHIGYMGMYVWKVHKTKKACKASLFYYKSIRFDDEEYKPSPSENLYLPSKDVFNPHIIEGCPEFIRSALGAAILKSISCTCRYTWFRKSPLAKKYTNELAAADEANNNRKNS